jgi:phage terminase small subunit
MSRGPQRTPTKILIDRGSEHGLARSLNEVQGTDGIPKPWPFIQGNTEALEMYAILLRDIGALGVLKTQDGLALSICAEAIAKGNQCERMIPETGGDCIDHPKKGLIVNPWSRRARDARADAVKIIQAYGLTASARVGLTTQAVAAVSGAAKLAARFTNVKKT